MRQILLTNVKLRLLTNSNQIYKIAFKIVLLLNYLHAPHIN